MQTKKSKSTRQDRAKAKTTLECHHEAIELEDIALRNECYFHIMTLITTSPWWLAFTPDKRDAIVQHVVSSFDKDAALDVLYG